LRPSDRTVPAQNGRGEQDRARRRGSRAVEPAERATALKSPAYVSLVHLGCARNLIDSEVMLGRMADEGLVITDDPDSAHTVISDIEGTPIPSR
jgi:hypothetical protein